MNHLSETIFKTAIEQAKQLADAVAKQLKQVISTQGKAVLAVSGGRSPIAFFAALSVIDLAWEKVTIILVDERVVSTSHPDSNTLLVRKYLGINQAERATFHGSLNDDLSEEQLKDTQTLCAVASENFIQPDVVVLGMGEDAHTASLFPHVADLATLDNIIAVVPKTATHTRLSLSLKAILSAQCIFLAIGGSRKRAVYEKAKAEKTISMPISYVLHQDSTRINVYWHE
ncbi:MAG: 6-phosphogluconolactonase [Ostreibacterium sp.]